MRHQDQMILPGFSTVKRLSLRRHKLFLLEYDLLQWREHETAIEVRRASLPKVPRSKNVESMAAWRKAAEEVMKRPLPPLIPVRVWELGSYEGAPVYPWLQGRREPLNQEVVQQLKAFLSSASASS